VTKKKVSRWVVGTGIAGTVSIAGLAFWLSFTALTHLARRAGIAEQQAWAWPLIVDGIIVVATVAVVALRQRKGQGYSWLLLIAGALVSVTANAVQAAMPAGVTLPPALAAAVSAVPPIVLLAITHLTVVLARHEDQEDAPDTEPLRPEATITTTPAPPTPVAPTVVPAAALPTSSSPVQPEPVSALPSPPTSQAANATTPSVPPAPLGHAEPLTTTPSQSTDTPVSGSALTPTAVTPDEATASQPTESQPTESLDDLSEDDLRRLLLGIGTDLPTDTDAPGNPSRTYLVTEAKRLKRKGLTNRAIGDQLGVDPTTIGRWLRKHDEETNDA